ncbi:MAG: site-specific integrase [Nitrososphaerota archaeon]|jgi:site-specific recombinase XerD|nr:site-specific integrase [Nitrososphaerota archaeon]
MLQPTSALVPAINSTRNLSIEELKNLKLPLIFQDDNVIITHSINGWKLRQPVTIERDKILAAKEKGLVNYIIRSCISERPNLIPYIFEYKSVQKMLRHFLRHCSESNDSCILYTSKLKKYADWLGHNPDIIIQDITTTESIPDSQKIQTHCRFLNEYLAYLQDSGLQPGTVNGCIKAVKTFYRTNGIKGIGLDEPLKRKVVYKDRAPKPEEIAQMLDRAAIREAFIVAALASGGFREGTFAKLKYRHVKEDLEAGRVPIHIHVEAAITKGKYHDYDTFINQEASHLLKLYIQDRKKGGRSMPPETLTDESPLIRNSHNTSRVLGVTEKTIRKIVHTLAVNAQIAKKLPNSWMYSVRTHSLRKFFRSQLSTAKIDPEIVEYMMGHTINTYTDIQSLGIETLRNSYAAAGLSIRPKTQVNRIEQLREIIRAWGENPEELLSKDALIRGNITETQEQYKNHQLSILADQLKQIIRKELAK